MVDFSKRVDTAGYTAFSNELYDLARRYKTQFDLHGAFDRPMRKHMVGMTGPGLMSVLCAVVEAAHEQHLRHAQGIVDPNLDADMQSVEDTIETLVVSMNSDPSSRDDPSRMQTDSAGTWSMRNALSTVKAMFKSWCNIPPICS